MNFTSGIEWYFNVNTETCSGFGLDYWNDWCYGEVENTKSIGTLSIAGVTCDVWGVQNSDLWFSNTQNSCIPVTRARSSAEELTLYYGYTPTVDPGYFIPNPACHRAEVVGPAPAEHLERIRGAVISTKKRL